MHGKLSTGALLYRLNIGPFNLCPFCGLEEETTEHIIWYCSKISRSWTSILHSFGLNANDLTFLSSGSWLTFEKFSRSSSAWAFLRSCNPDLIPSLLELLLFVLNFSLLLARSTGSSLHPFLFFTPLTQLPFLLMSLGPQDLTFLG